MPKAKKRSPRAAEGPSNNGPADQYAGSRPSPERTAGRLERLEAAIADADEMIESENTTDAAREKLKERLAGWEAQADALRGQSA